MNDIVKKYGLPRKEVSCPSCGQLYGHHNTLVDEISEECAPCARVYKKPMRLVDVDTFMREVILK